MSDNYNETRVEGTKHTRCNRIEIINNYEQTSTLQIVEEEIVCMDNAIMKKHKSTIDISFDINNLKHLQLYGLLNDIYIEERTKRDNPIIVENIEPTIIENTEPEVI